MTPERVINPLVTVRPRFRRDESGEKSQHASPLCVPSPTWFFFLCLLRFVNTPL